MSGDERMTPELEARFDAELSRAARALATEDLPRGILDAGLVRGAGGAGTVRARRSVPAYAGFAAVIVLLVATAIALVPGGGPPAASTPPSPTASSTPASGPSASPAATPFPPGTFRTTLDIRADFVRLRYDCRRGNELLPTGPSPSAMVMEGAICTAPADAGPYIAAVIVGEARDGRVVEVHVKANLTGDDTPAARAEIAVPLAKAVAIAASGAGVGDQLAAWVLDAVPTLTLDDSDSTELLGFVMKVTRSSSGAYQLVMFEAPTPS